MTSEEAASEESKSMRARAVKRVFYCTRISCQIIAVGILTVFLNRKHTGQFSNDREEGLLIGVLVSISLAIGMEMLHVMVSHAYPEVAWLGKLKAAED